MPITPSNPFKGRQYPGEVILLAVRWYLRYPLAYLHLSEILTERGLFIDASCIWRWVQAYAPELDKRCRPHLKPTKKSYRVDETYIYKKGSSGESVGNWRVSALGLSEEAVELAAGGVEGALLVFPAVVDQRPAVLMDHVADKLFRGALSQTRLFVHVADDLSAEKPHIVDVVLDGPFRQAGLGEVKEEGHEVFHELSADRKILFLAHPTLRPLRKIAAIAAVGQ